MARMISGYLNNLTDDDGTKWLDLQSGILNTPLGHGNVVVSNALSDVRTSGLINTYDRTANNADELRLRMREYQPGFEWKLFNTGGEAVDKAIQVVATIRDRMPTVAVLGSAFHGKLISMSWANFGDRLPWGNPLNLIVIDPHAPETEIPDFDMLIYEPVQGHSGHAPIQPVLRDLCDDRAAFLVADEMITGFLRCGVRFMGSSFADIIITGKGISGGAPLSLLGINDELFGLLPQRNIPVGWRSTGAGNNLCATIGNCILGELMACEESLIRDVLSIEDRLVSLGFSAHGALGFKSLRDFSRTRAIFEDRKIIASWHNPPLMRVGPSFVTSEQELDRLTATLHIAGEL